LVGLSLGYLALEEKDAETSSAGQAKGTIGKPVSYLLGRLAFVPPLACHPEEGVPIAIGMWWVLRESIREEGSQGLWLLRIRVLTGGK
jgi:hypothetical protein